MFAKEGLEGVVAARTGLSRIDGERGTLAYRGYAIHDLAEHATFEEAVHLLWHGELPTRARLVATRTDLAAHRALARRLRSRGLPTPRRSPGSNDPRARRSAPATTKTSTAS